MNLLLVHEEEQLASGLLHLAHDRAAHIAKVLRKQVGDTVRVGKPRGELGHAVIESMCAGAVLLRPEWTALSTQRPRIDIVLAIPRPKVLSRCLFACAAAGVGTIELTNSWRVEKSYLGSERLDPIHVRRDLWLGCEQGGHTWLPEVKVHRRFMQCIEGLPSTDERGRWLAHPHHADTASLAEANAGRHVIAVGPEGGWIEREITTLAQNRFRLVSLRLPILKVEHAIIAALAQCALATAI